MQIKLTTTSETETNSSTITVDSTTTVELCEVYNGVGFPCDDGLFGVAQRDGGIEVLKDGVKVYPILFDEARLQMGAAIFEDPELYQAYASNIAMLLHDHFDGADFKDHGVRNEAAAMLLSLLFKSR